MVLTNYWKINIIALGETREITLHPSTIINCFDTIEWAVKIDQLKMVLDILKSQGLKPTTLMRKVKGRRASVIHLQDKLKRNLRLTGLVKLPVPLKSHVHRPNLFFLNNENYWQFMSSRQASLNMRRDQVLFDMQDKKTEVPEKIKTANFNRLSPSYQMKNLLEQILGI